MGTPEMTVSMEEYHAALDKAEKHRNTANHYIGVAARLERELADRPTVWAYARACKALNHWRAEAARLGELAGVEPRLMTETEPA